MEPAKLKQLGFKEVRPDKVDKGYFFFRKDIKHPFLKRLHIIIERSHISVYCLEQSSLDKKAREQEAVIYMCYGNEFNLLAILKWLGCSPISERSGKK